MAKNQKIVFFDIDGTLLNTGGAGQHAMECALVDDFRITFPFDGVLTAGRTDRGIADEIFARYDLENTAVNRERFRHAYLSRLPDCLADSPGLLLPQVRQLLESLAQIDHLELSLLTGNYEDGAWIKLRHYKLDGFFRFGGFGDHDADRDDVARKAISAASASMGFNVVGHQTMVIGDTAADIQCARAIGAKAVAVATGKFAVEELSSHEPDLLFDDFSDNKSVIEQMLELL